MRAVFVGVMFASLAACGPRSVVTISPAEQWALSWSDEFDGAAGTSPDSSKWVLETGRGNGGWGNAELETYTTSPDNVALDGQGHLVINALRQAKDGAQYTSARLTTQGLFEQRYGRFEASLKLPAGTGLWPAFWMLGADVGSAGWPACGEIDVVEMRGHQTNIALGTVHGPGYSGGDAISKKYTLAEGSFAEDFHLFAVQWDPSQITFSVDGEIYQTVAARSIVTTNRTWVYDAPFFLILNLAVGGNFLGAAQPSAETPFPAAMTVDYVRAYQRVP